MKLKRKPTFTELMKLKEVFFRLQHEWQNIKRVMRGEDPIPYSTVKPGNNFNKPKR